MDREKIEQKLESDVNELDLSRDEDLSIGLMNLISIEEHLFFTHEKTGNEKHLDMLSEVRKIRTDAMEEIVNDTEGEEWCISKHLLSAAMRFRETGDKMLDRDREKAKQFYDRSFSLYSMFWAVNFELEADSGEEFQETPRTREKPSNSNSEDKTEPEQDSWLDSVKSTVKSAVDCCREI